MLAILSAMTMAPAILIYCRDDIVTVSRSFLQLLRAVGVNLGYRIGKTQAIIYALGGALIAVTCVGCGDGTDWWSAGRIHGYAVFKSMLDRADDAIEAAPMAQRQRECARDNGQWAQHVEVTACRDHVATVEVDGAAQVQACDGGDGDVFEGMCVHTDPGGLFYFNDGPTVPAIMLQASQLLGASLDQMRYATLFWVAGEAHDYCYHHNPLSYGLSKQDCDDQFHSDLSAVCAQPNDGRDWFSKDGCDVYATSLYAAVAAGGESSFGVSNTAVQYPPWQPLWRQFGMAAEATDDELKARVDDIIGHIL